MARFINRAGKLVGVSAIVWAVLFLCAGASGAAEKEDEPQEEKASVMRQVGQEWIKVGAAQFKRALFEAAEKSFTEAAAYEEYLSEGERKEINNWLEKTRKATSERQVALEHIRKAGELVESGEQIKAKAHYEKVRSSELLTEQERKQTAEHLRNIDEHFDSQKKNINELYNKSVELYHAGELDKARDGFLEVTRYGLLSTPKGKSPEDYLVEIDVVLTERLKNTLPFQRPQEVNRPAEKPREEIGSDILEVAPVVQDDEKSRQKEPNEETPEVLVAAEPTEQQVGDIKNEQDNRTRLVQSYLEAVVKDTENKVDEYIIKGEMTKAVEAVRTAAELVREKREQTGEELFSDFSARLRSLADKIIQTQDKQERR